MLCPLGVGGDLCPAQARARAAAGLSGSVRSEGAIGCAESVCQPVRRWRELVCSITPSARPIVRVFWSANFCKRIDFAVGTLEGKIPCLPTGRVGDVLYHHVFSAIGPTFLFVGYRIPVEAN